MSEFVITLIASSKPVTPAHLGVLTRYLDSQGIALTGNPQWLTHHVAADLYLAQRPNSDQMRAMRTALGPDKIDILVNRVEGRRKKLILCDMDATILDGETLDELADFIDCKAETAEITEKTMRGELDFADALRERVSILKGLHEATLQQTLDCINMMGGAELLIATMRHKGATCVLVSGGFTVFTKAVAEQLGFHHHHGNVLEIKNKHLTGHVSEPILDKQAKLDVLEKYRAVLGLEYHEVLAVGDGANDLMMLESAGLGIGFRPKPVVAEKLDNLILYGDLRAVLYAQGLVPVLH